MYRYLANKLSDVFQKKQITQQDLDTALHEVTQALLDADVALEAVEAFKSNFSAQNIEQQREKGLDAKSQLMNEVRRCLLTLLTDSQQAPTLNKGQLHNIVLCGLQGAGKTTTCAKLAQHYLSQELKILMCSTDIYRPAAMEQLRQLATQIGVDYFDTQLTDAVQIALDAQQHAKSQGYDLLIIDTAGRLNLDVARMQEAAAIVKKTTPQQCLYVVDSMIGQSALTVAKAFNEHLPLNGVILTKTDSDAYHQTTYSLDWYW
jgi:signal recognition particle subunit SRP54